MKLYLFNYAREDSQNAYTKAPLDVFRILSNLPQAAVVDASFIAESETEIQNRLWSFLINAKRKILLYLRCILGLVKFEPGSIMFIQYPQDAFAIGRWEPDFSRMLVRKAIHRRGGKIAFLVHDVNELRPLANSNVAAEIKHRKAMIRDADCLIVHNWRMLDWFVGEGVSRTKIVNLDIFDYLSSFVPPVQIPFKRAVTIAGALVPSKAKYLQELRNIRDVEWHLYGNGFDNATYGGENIHYHGGSPADEVPSKLNCGFGLVWDGDSIDTCSGSTGQYLRYNNPHKLSLYLAAGLPVMIWREAAEADFVTRNGVGVVVDSLREINEVMSGISDMDYSAMRERVLALSSKLRSGYFTRSAAKAMMELLLPNSQTACN